jgi:perosamine synthetase
MLGGAKKMQKLAILGGSAEIKHGFKKYNPIGKEEMAAAIKVIKSGVLSQFVGCWDKDFYGGKKVKEFEAKFAKAFKSKYAVSVNSATSGLIIAVGACGIGPGDEVIVSPYTMSASATAILANNAIPVFADIEGKTFNLSPESIEKNITQYTKAIMVPNIFGHPANYRKILQLAKKYKLKIIEDNAQSPSAMYHGKYAGTIGDIGVFSLNYHKHIHTGEGGICLTKDRNLAERMRLIRNHAEAVIAGRGDKYLVNMIGFNYRFCELEAAIGIEQLKKMKKLVKTRVSIAEELSKGLKDITMLETPHIEQGCTHVYYVYPLLYKGAAIARESVVKALKKEGVPIDNGYATPLYMQPLYQKMIGYGTNGCPFKCAFYKGNISYKKGICPVVEEVEEKKLMLMEICRYDLTKNDIKSVITAFHKIFSNLDKLKNA